MSKNRDTEREALDRLADALVNDILNTSDEEILDEFRESGSDPAEHAEQWRKRFEQTVMTVNKQRLAVAKSGVEASRVRSSRVRPPIDIAEARRRLRAASDNGDASYGLTLAARKESEMSDADVLGIVDALHELGVFPEDNDDGKDP